MTNEEHRIVYRENRRLAYNYHAIDSKTFDSICTSIASEEHANNDQPRSPVRFSMASQYVRAIGEKATNNKDRMRYFRSLYTTAQSPLIDFVDAQGKRRKKGSFYCEG